MLTTAFNSPQVSMPHPVTPTSRSFSKSSNGATRLRYIFAKANKKITSAGGLQASNLSSAPRRTAVPSFSQLPRATAQQTHDVAEFLLGPLQPSQHFGPFSSGSDTCSETLRIAANLQKQTLAPRAVALNEASMLKATADMMRLAINGCRVHGNAGTSCPSNASVHLRMVGITQERGREGARERGE